MSTPLTFRYSPLGWGQWLYGPFFLCVGLFLVYEWFLGVTQTFMSALQAPVVAGASRMSVVALRFICRSSVPCDGFEFWFGIGAWIIFAIVAFGLTIAAVLLMSFDRITSVSKNTLVTHRGRLFSWHRETFSASAFSSWTIEKVPILMVVGHRVTTSWYRWRVVGMFDRTGKKQQRLIVALFDFEEDAKKTRDAIASTL